jgi:AcrR family transcriptional regulator
VTTLSGAMSVIELNPRSGDHRERLLEGLAASIREKGLAGTQITDIVRHARASRRTFYQCFADKDACFLELAEAVGNLAREVVSGAIVADAPWDRQVEQAVDAYLGLLAADPKMAVAVSSELPTLGAPWLAIRNAGIERFASLVVDMSRSPSMRAGGIQPMSIETAVMVVAGLDGMVARAVRRDESILDLAPTAKAIVKAVFVGHGTRRRSGGDNRSAGSASRRERQSAS